MRELDFLPAWYPQVRRRRKRLVTQAYCAALAVAIMIGWQVVAQRNIRGNERKLVDLRGKLDVAAIEIQKETQLELLKTELGRKLAINGKVGSCVATTRLLRAVEQCMPEPMTLVSFTVEVEEYRPAGTTKLAAARAAQKSDEPAERRLRVTVVGVAPSDGELAEFLRKLGEVPVFEQVTMTYARPRDDERYIMRESEVTFCVDLRAPGASTATASAGG